MGKTLYLECYSGISGDMTVAALLDLGADPAVLERTLRSLPVSGFQTVISRVKKSGLDACDFAVKLDKKHENHDHDMEYLHGHPHSHEGEHGHHHSHECEHGHSHEEAHGHTHYHEHRGMKEIREIIQGSDMTERAKKTALCIFEVLAQAESKAHGLPVEEVHFHEVGAVDSIVDIAAAAVCLDDLDITEVIVPVLYEGTGFIRCQHGVIPVPVPAVVNIASAHDLKLKITEIQGELVTPTGAAIVAALRTSEKLPEEFRIIRTGLGAGKRKYECPGLLRAMLIEKTEIFSDRIYRLETNIDDCTGENFGYVMDLLLKEGAKDVSFIPLFMKKNRPAYQLNVICDRDNVKKMEQIIFAETTTIGIRKMEMERTVLPREIRQVMTPYGTAAVKICTLPDGQKRIYPEYQDAAKLAAEHKLSFREMYDRICEACGEE